MIRIALLGMALIFTNMIYAQREHVEFGIKGGVNFANLHFGSSNNTDTRTGFHVGMLTHIHLNKSFAVQPELVYSAQGAAYSNGRKDKLNYVNIPVLVQLMLGKGFRLETGPQIGFLASAKSKTGSSESDVKGNLKATDFSWSFGTGYLTTSGLGVDVRYNLGINNISKTSPDIQNRVWQVGLFYQFGK